PPVEPSDSLGGLSKADSMGGDSVGMDSMVVDSLDTLSVEQGDSTYRLVVAYRNTKTYQGKQQSISDSMSMDSRDSTLHLYISPYLWNGLNQISSEVMDIYSAQGEITHAVFSEGKPIMSSKIDTSYFNQVGGKIITSYFKNGELVRNEVDGNVQTIYFVQDDYTREVTTMVYVESGAATFYIVNQDLEGITYRAEPSYTFYPVALIPESQPRKLEGFEWRGEERPQRSDFSDRVQRVSVRDEKEALPRPAFPIQRAINIDIENFVKDRYWMDRTDVVSSQAEEWLESLGYKSGQPRTEPIK
ncbi:MAG: hypothetical protein SNG10_05545, partial [Rikenellaceae bacterium]